MKDMQGLKIGKQFSTLHKGIMLARVEKKPSLNTGKNNAFHANEYQSNGLLSNDSSTEFDLHNHNKYCLKLRCSIRFHNQIVLINK